MTALTAGQEAEARALADALAQASAADLLAVARRLVSRPSHQAFGQTAPQLRDLVHRLGAKALDLYLAGEKPATRAPA